MRKLSLVASASALALSTGANAQDLNFDGNWYIQGGGGVNWALDTDLSFVASGVPTASATIDWDIGWLAGGAVGYAWDNGFRTEVEGVYRSNGLDTLSNLSSNLTVVPGADAEVDSIGIMFNLFYDIDTGSAITPYIGGGVGAGYVDYEISGVGSASDDTWGVALQAIAGASYAISDSFDLFADYRYYTVLDSDVSLVTPGGGSATNIDDDYAAHSLFFGARYHFLPPPPPPPPPAPVAEEPPPPPPPAQDRFIVFFDWDRSNLTPQANGVLDDVVATYNQAGFAQVLAEAHTDTSGPATYNVGLSQRRGESVRQGLIARGIAPDEIVVRAFGETQLLVPTPDGVREPQNRRVEIILM